jgi:arabinofuranosyltransferase
MKDRLPILLSLCAAGLTFAILSRNAMSDDAHITMRIVRHALEGDGLRYNVGDSGVQPATSPLNLLFLLVISGLLTLFGVGVEQAVLTAPMLVACLALPAFGCAMYLLMCGDRRFSFAAAIVATIAMGIPISLQTMGLETILSMALCMAAVIAYRGNQFAPMGWLLGLAFLARHDAVIFAGILYFLYWRESRSKPDAKPLNALIGFLAIVGPWVIFSLLYYGAATPTTLESKAAQGGTAYWPAWYPTKLGHWLQVYFAGSPALVAVASIAAVCGAVVAIWKRTRAAMSVLLFALYQFLVFAAYSVMRMPDYHWYFVPYGITVLLLAGYGISLLTANFNYKGATAASVLGIAIATIALAQHAPSAGGPWSAYREVGRYLESNPPAKAAGLMEIGIIGFYAPSVRVFDFAGVATLEQAERVSRNEAHGWLDDPSVADVVVIRGVEHPLEPDFDDRFESLYRHEWTGTPTEVFPNGLQVWRLR